MSLTSILIVEETIPIAHELKDILDKLGYKVISVAFSGKEALQIIAQFKPSILLMNMHYMGAQNTTKTGSLIHEFQDIPVLFIIDKSGQETIRRAGENKPFGYIFRPFDDKQIYATIETALIRHQLETELYQNRKWLTTILTSIDDGVIATNKQGQIDFINLAAMRLTGWQDTEAAGKPLYEVFSLIDESTHAPVEITDAPEGTGKDISKKSLEGLLCAKDGKVILVEANIAPIKDGKGRTYGTVLAFRDITQQREATFEIKRQADRAETLLQVTALINNEIELEAVLKKICESTARLLKSFGALVFFKDAKANVFRIVAATSEDLLLQSNRGTQLEISVEIIQPFVNSENPIAVIPDPQAYAIAPDFEALRKLNIHTLALASVLREGAMIGVLVSAYTQTLSSLSTDELKLFKGLADQAGIAMANASYIERLRASREKQQLLARQLVKVQEDERRSLARELHDEIGQMLTGLQFIIKSSLSSSNDEQRNKLEQAQTIVSETISQIREMSINLHPSLLDDLGILTTLNWYFDQYQTKTGIQVNFQHQNLDKRFSPELEITTFRIIQEALTNVARHAGVETVAVQVKVSEHIMQLYIDDQGQGFDMGELARGQSMGLEGMRERAYDLGGLLEIQAEPGRGTHIVATLPLEGQLLIERRRNVRYHSSGR